MNTFEHPTVRELPADVSQYTTQLVFAIAQSAQAGTGLLRWGPTVQAPQEVVDDIAVYVRGGKPVLLGIGGSDDGGITLTNGQQVEEFCTSVQSLVEKYGFTGIDLDLEPSGGAWNEASVYAVTTKLKALYGNNFLIGLTVGLYAEFTARWISLAKVLGSSFDYWSPMLYDFPAAHDDRLTPVAMDTVAVAVSGGVPAGKQVLGFMCNAYYNTSPVDVTERVVQSVTKKYPGIRGAYIWESKLELAAKYEWTRNVGKTLSEQNP